MHARALPPVHVRPLPPPDLWHASSTVIGSNVDESRACRPRALQRVLAASPDEAFSTLPERTTRVLPPIRRPAIDCAAPPPRAVRRAVLFVDCFGDLPFKVYGVETTDGTDVAVIKQSVCELAIGAHTGEDPWTLVLGCLGRSERSPCNPIWRVLGEDATFPESSLAHTRGSFQFYRAIPDRCTPSRDSVPDARVWTDQSPMVCWRVAKVPDAVKNTGALGDDANVHYVCLSLFANRGTAVESGDAVMSMLSVPLLVPAVDADGSVRLCGQTASKVQSEAIASAALGALARICGVPAQDLAPSALKHVTASSVLPPRSATWYASGDAARPAAMACASLQNFYGTSSRFHVACKPSKSDGRSRDRYETGAIAFSLHPHAPKSAHILNLSLLLDPHPFTGGEAWLTQRDPVIGGKIDIERLVAPPVDETASDGVLASAASHVAQVRAARKWSRTPLRAAEYAAGRHTSFEYGLPFDTYLAKTEIETSDASDGERRHHLRVQTFLSPQGAGASPYTTGIAKLGTLVECPDGLRNVFEAALWDNADHQRQIRYVRDTARVPRDMSKLMETLSVGDDADALVADQLPGFVAGLELLAHQRRTLAAMVAIESMPLRDRLWAHVTGSVRSSDCSFCLVLTNRCA